MANLMFVFAVLTISSFYSLTLAKYDIIDITIPHTAWDGVKTVLCTAHPIKANQYIKSFYPLRRLNTVRHISTAFCETPYSNENYWECATPNRTCSTSTVSLCSLARDAPAWYLPEDLAVLTGKKDGYILVQIHAPGGMKLESTPEFFATGLRLNITDEKPKYYSAMADYGNGGYIPANTSNFPADAACVWPYDNNPIFAVAIHSHTMATAISGYIYKKGTFIELLRADPVYPEPIIDISQRNLVLEKGDIVIMRCTLTNPTDKIAKFGFEHTDEMCNFSLFYGIPTDDYGTYDEVVCGRDAQTFHLKDIVLPEDSTVPDKEGYAKLMASYNLTRREY